METHESILDQGANGKPKAFVARLDARARILSVLIFAVCVVSINDWRILSAALFLAVLPFVFSGLPLLKTTKRILTMDAFIVFMLITLPFTVDGKILMSIGPFHASAEGLEKAILIGLKANIIAMVLLTFIGSMEPPLFGQALHRLKCPDSFIHLLLFTIRYIDVIRAEYAKLRLSMRARAFTMGTNIHTYKSLGYLIGMLLIRSLERSERILKAMKCRGFDGRLYVIYPMVWQKRDTIFMLAVATLSGFLQACYQILGNFHG